MVNALMALPELETVTLHGSNVSPAGIEPLEQRPSLRALYWRDSPALEIVPAPDPAAAAAEPSATPVITPVTEPALSSAPKPP
jgi:hypothetical protein